jgi:hypothetical protein
VEKTTKKSANAKAGRLSSKEKLLREISANKQAAHQETLLKLWKEQLNAMEKMSNSDRLTHLQGLERNKKFDDPFLAAEFGLYKLHVRLSGWVGDPDRDSDITRDRQTVSIMRLIKSIIDRKCVTATASAVLSSVLAALGFAAYAPSMAIPSGNIADRPLSFEFKKLFGSKRREPYYEFMKITEHPVNWQLRLFGEHMDRSMESQKDERVSFQADAWQIRVLDAIDRGDSLLVVGSSSL